MVNIKEIYSFIARIYNICMYVCTYNTHVCFYDQVYT